MILSKYLICFIFSMLSGVYWKDFQLEQTLTSNFRISSCIERMFLKDKYKTFNLNVFVLCITVIQWDSCHSIFSFNCNVLQIVVCPFVHFLLVIVLSVILRFTDSDYPFGIFKLFFYHLPFVQPSGNKIKDTIFITNFSLINCKLLNVQRQIISG